MKLKFRNFDILDYFLFVTFERFKYYLILYIFLIKFKLKLNMEGEK